MIPQAERGVRASADTSLRIGVYSTVTGVEGEAGMSSDALTDLATMVGYADTAAGRQVAFAIFLSDLAFGSFDEFFAAGTTRARSLWRSRRPTRVRIGRSHRRPHCSGFR